VGQGDPGRQHQARIIRHLVRACFINPNRRMTASGHKPKCSMWAKHDRSTPESGLYVAARHISGAPCPFDMRAGHTGAMGHRVVIQPSNFAALDHAPRTRRQGVVRHQIDAVEQAARRARVNDRRILNGISGSHDRERHGAISRVASVHTPPTSLRPTTSPSSSLLR
jgi:hypothetical protein